MNEDEDLAMEHPEMPRLAREKAEWMTLLDNARANSVDKKDLDALIENVRRKTSRGDDTFSPSSADTIPVTALVNRIAMTVDHCRVACVNTKVLLERASVANCSSLCALHNRQMSCEREAIRAVRLSGESLTPTGLLKTFARSAKQCSVCDDLLKKSAALSSSSI